MLLSAKRKCESELHEKMGVLRAYEVHNMYLNLLLLMYAYATQNSIKQYTAKINEFEKRHDRNMATIKTLQTERDTAVSE